MAYNKFTLQEAVERLNLKTVSVKSIVKSFEPYPPSDFLQTALQRGVLNRIRPAIFCKRLCNAAPPLPCAAVPKKPARK